VKRGVVDPTPDRGAVEILADLESGTVHSAFRRDGSLPCDGESLYRGEGVWRNRASMPYALVQDIAASWHEYQRVTADIVVRAVPGLIVHVAGPTDEGVGVIEVWTSEGAWRRFRDDRLAPAIAALGRPSRPEPTFRDVHAARVVFGASRRAAAHRSQREGG